MPDLRLLRIYRDLIKDRDWLSQMFDGVTIGGILSHYTYYSGLTHDSFGERQMVDFTKPLQTIDGDHVEYVRKVTHGTHPHIVLVNEDGDQIATHVNDEGDTDDSNGFIQNVAPFSHPADVHVLAEGARFPVNHTKRGPGVVHAIRPHARKKFGIMLDSGARPGDGGLLWALDKNVQVATRG